VAVFAGIWIATTEGTLRPRVLSAGR